MNLTAVSLPDRAAKLGVLSVAELKASQRISTTSEDSLLEDLIVAAYDFFDGRTGWLNRALLTQQWRLALPAFSDRIEIPLPPLQSVDLIRYRRAADNAWATLYEPAASPAVLSDILHVVSGDLVGRVERLHAKAWPATRIHPEAVEVTFTAGFGDASLVPDGIKRAIAMLAGHYYRHREETYEEVQSRALKMNPLAAMQHLAGPYRIPHHHSDA